MKPLLLCVSLLFAAQYVLAAFPKPSVADSANTLFYQQPFLLKQFGTIKMKEYEQQTGRKLNFKDRLGFKLLQHRFKKEQNGVHKSNVLTAIGGFFLGLLLPVVGIGIAYVFSKNKTLRMWAWIGFGVFFLLFIYVLLVVSLSEALLKLTFSSII